MESHQVDQRDAIQSLLDMLPMVAAHVALALIEEPKSPAQAAEWMRGLGRSLQNADLAAPFFGRAAAKALDEYADAFERAAERVADGDALLPFTVIDGGKED